MKIIPLLLATFLVIPAHAQEETLLGSTEVEHGGYGALVVKFTSVNDEIGLLVGGRGGWIINHSFSIGIAGYGLANNVKAHSVGPFGQRFVDLGYGGLDLEYVSHSDNLVHFSIHSLIGAGAAGFRHGRLADGGWDGDDGDNSYHERDAFFVIEPGVNVDLNVISWFRASAGVGYRYVAGLASDATTNSDLTGPSAMLTFRFGSF